LFGCPGVFEEDGQDNIWQDPIWCGGCAAPDKHFFLAVPFWVILKTIEKKMKGKFFLSSIFKGENLDAEKTEKLRPKVLDLCFLFRGIIFFSE